MTVENITEFLNAHNIKPSYQRIKIYEYLVHSDEHPSAELIYRELIKTIPTLSKTTIYNSLKTFVKEGIVKVVTLDGNEMHYDSVLEEHGHFICRKCGKLFNISIDLSQSFSELGSGFEVEERSIYLKGVCNQCNQK